MEIKSCLREHCFEAAIRAPRSTGLCRGHYVEALDADDPALTTSIAATPLVRCEVIGQSPITDARTCCGVVAGELVDLDPVETNITALVYGGHVKVLPAGKAAKTSKAG